MAQWAQLPPVTLDLNNVGSGVVWDVAGMGLATVEIETPSWGSAVVTIKRSNDPQQLRWYALETSVTRSSDGMTDKIDVRGFRYLRAEVTTAHGAQAVARAICYVLESQEGVANISGATNAAQYVTLATDPSLTAERVLAVSTGLSLTDGGAGGNVTIAPANDLAALEGLSGTGLVARTGSETYSTRTITGPAAGLTVSNGDGVAGNPTLALANDLAALEAMSSTGLVARTASETYAQRTITAGTDVSVSNGDGVSGNPTISLPSTVTTNARVAVRKNTGAVVGTRRRLNFIEGTNVTLTIADDGVDEEVDVTIAASGGGGTGDVVGPGSATDNAVARFDGTTGKLIQNSTLIVDDTGNVTHPGYDDWTEIAAPSNPSANALRASAYDTNGVTVGRLADSAGNVVLIGLNEYVVAYNNTGGTLSKGTAVAMNTTAAGHSGNHPEIIKADCDTTDNMRCIGLVAVDIANLSWGLVLRRGRLSNFDTSALTANAAAYVSTTAGALTTTASQYGYIQVVGTCVTSHATTGTFEVDPLGIRNDGASRCGPATFTIAGTSATSARAISFVNATGTITLRATPSSSIYAIDLPDTYGTALVAPTTSTTTTDLTFATATGGIVSFRALATGDIPNDTVTYAKIQNVSAASRILGRGSAAGAGDVEELTVTSPIKISSTSVAFDSTVALDNNARVTVRKNTGADVGSRRRMNFIEGSNITITATDDSGSEEVDITIAASGGSGLTYAEVRRLIFIHG